MDSKNAPDVDVVITLDDDHIGKIKSITNRLAARGLTVGNVMKSSGIITGTAKSDAMAALKAEKGVLALEASGDVQIAPPEADVQ